MTTDGYRDEYIKSIMERLEYAEKKIDELCMHNVQLEKLKTLTEESLKNHMEKLEDCESRIKEIERRPGTMWDKVTGSIITAIASGLIAALISLVLK